MAVRTYSRRSASEAAPRNLSPELRPRAFRPLSNLLCLVLAAVATQAATLTSSTGARAQASLRAGGALLSRLPLSFEPNQGQGPEGARFLARGPGYSLLLRATEAELRLRGGEGKPAESLRIRLQGASSSPRVVGELPLPGKVSYLIGREAAHWRTQVPTFARVRCRGVYPGVDLLYYGTQGRLEYDFVVAPERDPQAIRMVFTGARGRSLTSRGDLLLETAGGPVTLRRPTVYQEVSGRRKPVAGRYALLPRGRVGFRLGRYDRSRPLVIDPEVVYATYLGGSGWDQAQSIAVDAAGCVYVAGCTSRGTFPLQGSMPEPVGTDDLAFVAKINAQGTALVYSTYLGGSGGDEASGLCVSPDGFAFVTGSTRSGNFPTVKPLQPAPKGGSDAFLCQLNQQGSGLVFSTYLGGSGDDFGVDLVKVGDGVVVAGDSYSVDFPTASAYQSGFGGGTSSDVFVTRVRLGEQPEVVFSTYLGGAGQDRASGIAADAAGGLVVTGQTSSDAFPTRGALKATLGGDGDAFVARLDPRGAPQFITYLGGSQGDSGEDAALDAAGNVVVVGWTDSEDFPTKNPIQDRLQSRLDPEAPIREPDAFVCKLNPQGSALVYSTYLGGEAFDVAKGVALTPDGTAVLGGFTNSDSFPLASPFQSVHFPYAEAAFVTEVGPDGRLVTSSYFGGPDETMVEDVALGDGFFYLTGWTNAESFLVNHPLQGFFGGETDAFVVKVRLGEQPPAPTVTLAPARASNAEPVTVTVTGSPGALFANGAELRLRRQGQPDLVATAVTVLEAGRAFSALLDLRGKAAGVWDVVVTPSGGAPIMLAEGFVVLPGPELIVSPTEGLNLEPVTLTLQERNGLSVFTEGSTVKLQRAGQPDMVGTGVSVLMGGARLTATLDLRGKTPGAWDVVVTSPTGEALRLPGGFTVAAAQLSLSPAQAPADDALVLTVTETAGRAVFPAGMQATLLCAGQPALGALQVTPRPDGRSLEARFDAKGLAPGPWDVVLTRPDGQALTAAGLALTEPELVTVPTRVVPTDNLDLDIASAAGHGVFPQGTTLKLSRAGQPDVTPGQLQVTTNGRALEARWNLLGKPLGPWNVAITYPGGRIRVVTGLLTLEAPRLSVQPAQVEQGKQKVRIAESEHGCFFEPGCGVKLVRAGESEVTGAVTPLAAPAHALEVSLDLGPAALGAWDVVLSRPNGETLVLPAALTITGHEVTRRLFSSDSGTDWSSPDAPVWGEVLPRPGLGDPSGFRIPGLFAGVDFTLNWSPGGHALLSGDAGGTQPFVVDGRWTLTLRGPVTRTLSGTGSRAPLDLAALDLAAGVYGCRLVLELPEGAARYGTSSVYLKANAQHFREVETGQPVRALRIGADPVTAPVGQVVEIPVKLLSSPKPFRGVVTHLYFDPKGLQVFSTTDQQGWSIHAGAGQGSAYVSRPAVSGDTLLTLRVRCLRPGFWPVSFVGNYYGFGATEDPAVSLSYLQAVSDTISITGVDPPAAAPALTSGARIDPEDGSLWTTLTGSGLAAAAEAALLDDTGALAARTQDLTPGPSGTSLTAHFPVTPAGFYLLQVRDAQGTLLGSAGDTANPLLVPPALSLTRVGLSHAMPQIPGKAVTHLFRVTNRGTVKGTPVLGFSLPPYLAPEPRFFTQGLPEAQPLAHGLVDSLEPGRKMGWMEYLATPVAPGESTTVPLTMVLPPDVIFGRSPRLGRSDRVPLFSWVAADLRSTSWEKVAAAHSAGGMLDALAAEQAAAAAATQEQAENLARLVAMDPDRLDRYLELLSQDYPDLVSRTRRLVSQWRARGLPQEQESLRRPLGSPPRAVTNNALPPLPLSLQGSPEARRAYEIIKALSELDTEVTCLPSSELGADQLSLLVGVLLAGGPTERILYGAQLLADVGSISLNNSLVGLARNEYAKRRSEIGSEYGFPEDQPLSRAQLLKMAREGRQGTSLSILANTIEQMADGKSINSMSDSELARYLAVFENAYWCDEIDRLDKQNKYNMDEFRDWLRQVTGDSPPFPGSGCDGDEDSGSGSADGPRVATSMDPNDIAAMPGGEGEEGWIAGTPRLHYTVHFENMPDATAAAEDVRVTLKLDPNLDPASVELEESSFAGTQIAYDEAGGGLTWVLPGINLPPNGSPPQGEGWVSFSATPRSGLPTGTPIRQQARIFFDYNPPLDTPTARHTVDSTAPAALVEPLATRQPSAGFVVRWSGTDEGSGVASYDVYVSENGGAFRPWLAETAMTSEVFTGEPGGRYAFYAVARDRVGNLQAAPAAAQASTEVEGPADAAGDLNHNGHLDVGDVVVAIRILLRVLPATPELTALADLNKSGSVEIADVILILRRAVGIDR